MKSEEMTKVRKRYGQPVITVLGNVVALTAQNGTYGNKNAGGLDGNTYKPKPQGGGASGPLQY